MGKGKEWDVAKAWDAAKAEAWGPAGVAEAGAAQGAVAKADTAIHDPDDSDAPSEQGFGGASFLAPVEKRSSRLAYLISSKGSPGGSPS